MFHDRADVIHNVAMGNRDVGVVVEPDGKLSGNGINRRPTFEGRGRLRVGLQVRVVVGVGVAVRWGRASAGGDRVPMGWARDRAPEDRYPVPT